MISFVQMDQSVSKAHVTIHVMKIAIHVNHQLIAMMITRSVFHIVSREIVKKVLSVLMAIASNLTIAHQLKIVQKISIVTGKDIRF